MLITIPNIHLDPANWSVENNSSVNPVPMDRVDIYPESDHLRVVMEGPEWGGALVTYKPALPTTAQPLAYTGVDLQEWHDADTAAALHALECGDLKYCVAPFAGGVEVPNVADYSVQLNGPDWQIDNAVPDWVKTGFSPGQLPAETWNTMRFRHFTDFAAQKANFLSISDRGLSYSIPETMQGMPWLKTNWSYKIGSQLTPGLAYQFQADLGPNPGMLEFRIRVTLYAGDETIA